MQQKLWAERASSTVEQRAFPRNSVDLPGNLVVPAEDDTLPCRVLNLSGGGASIQCEEPPPLHTYVILCIPGFERLEAVTKRFVDGELGLQFVFKEAKRQRLLSDVYNHATGGAQASNLRRHVRLPSLSKVRITLAGGGGELSCDVIDVSIRGLSLRTPARPAIESLITIDAKYWRVARHHSEGIALEVIDMTDGQPHGH